MTISDKLYRVTASGGGECDKTPRAAVFAIDQATAQEISTLSALCRDRCLHKIEKFDYRADFLQFDPVTDPEDAQEQGEDNHVRTECDVLVVTKDEFYFQAYLKHAGDEGRVRCECQPISDLMAHFGLAVAA